VNATTAIFGTLTDYASGTAIRPATAAEWRKTAEAYHGGGAGDYTGAFDLDGRAVYVDGGPDMHPHRDAIIALCGEAAEAGNDAQVLLCDTALVVNAGYQATAAEANAAWGECVRVILDNRANAAE
jgi:hypothetical protein